MNSTKEIRESAPVLDAFDTLFNKRDYVAAERYAGAHPASTARRSNVIGDQCLKSFRPAGRPSAQHRRKQNPLELRDGRRVAPSLREQDRALERRQDEVADLFALEVLRKLAGLHERVKRSRPKN
jgi:hypothetical protein